MRFNLGDKLKGAANKIGEKVKSAVRFGMKHKGKIATAGAIVGLGLAGDDQDTIKDKARETATTIKDASLLQKIPAAQQGAVDIVSAVNKPSRRSLKKARKINEEQRRFIEGEMTDKEAKKFIKKRGKKAKKGKRD